MLVAKQRKGGGSKRGNAHHNLHWLEVWLMALTTSLDGKAVRFLWTLVADGPLDHHTGQTSTIDNTGRQNENHTPAPEHADHKPNLCIVMQRLSAAEEVNLKWQTAQFTSLRKRSRFWKTNTAQASKCMLVLEHKHRTRKGCQTFNCAGAMEPSQTRWCPNWPGAQVAVTIN